MTNKKVFSVFLALFQSVILLFAGLNPTKPFAKSWTESSQTFKNIIYVPSGTWEINETIILSDNTLLYGEGIGVSTLRLANNSNIDMIRNENSTKGNYNITIRDLTFDGNGNNQNGTFCIMGFTNIVNLTIFNCEFMGSKHAAIFIFRSTEEAPCENINISMCVFRDRKNLSTADLWINGFGTPPGWIRNVVVNNNQGVNCMKFAFMAVEKATITNNVLVNSDRGMVFRGVMDSIVRNNTFLDVNDPDGGSNYGGVWLQSQVGLWTKNVTIEENRVINSMAHGIGSLGNNHTKVIIRRNLIHNAVLGGIYCPNGINFTCVDNVVDNLTDIVLPPGSMSRNWIERLDFFDDDKINVRDLSPLTSRFGKTQNSSDWDALYDVYPDGKIDLRDITPAAQNFGMTKPNL